MIPYLADENFERFRILDDYMSFIWTERYYAPGDFELMVPITPQNLADFRPGRYITRDDREEWGIIEKIRLEKVERIEDSEARMIVSGRMVSSFLARRVIVPQYTLSLTVPLAVGSMISRNAANPELTRRQIPDLTVEVRSTSQAVIEQQFFGQNLLETVQTLCEKSGIGYKMIRQGSGWLFVIYDGKDRTVGQATNTRAVFSAELDNLEAGEYELNYQDLKNVVYIAGEGEGTERQQLWYEGFAPFPSGLDRFEAYRDGSGISTNNGEISDAEYTRLLRQAAAEEVTTFTQAFAGSVDLSFLQYKTDFDVGDMVTVVFPEWGISADVRLVEMIESTDESGLHTFTPTFGS